MSKPAKKQSPASSQIEVWALEDLKPYERNAREHPPEQVEKLARSITEFGFTIPLLVSEDGEIIAGHGRELAARSLGLAEVPVIVARGWSEERRRAYRIADNALALGSEWNDEFLRIELADLAADDFDVALTGLDLGEIDRLLEISPESAADVSEPKAGLAERFGIAPFSVMSAREGWWQDRKRSWLALGIQSELGRGEQLIPNGGGLASKERYDKGGASPGGSPRPSMTYSKDKARGDGRGRAISG